MNTLFGLPFSITRLPALAPETGSLSASVPTTLPFESKASSWPEPITKNAARLREKPKLGDAVSGVLPRGSVPAGGEGGSVAVYELVAPGP